DARERDALAGGVMERLTVQERLEEAETRLVAQVVEQLDEALQRLRDPRVQRGERLALGVLSEEPEELFDGVSQAEQSLGAPLCIGLESADLGQAFALEVDEGATHLRRVP